MYILHPSSFSWTFISIFFELLVLFLLLRVVHVAKGQTCLGCWFCNIVCSHYIINSSNPVRSNSSDLFVLPLLVSDETKNSTTAHWGGSGTAHLCLVLLYLNSAQVSLACLRSWDCCWLCMWPPWKPSTWWMDLPPICSLWQSPLV